MNLTEMHRKQIDEFFSHENPEKWLDSWHTTQGGNDWRKKHQIITGVMPFPADQKLKVLDLCAGPGDLGREILKRYPNAVIDAIDRDYFLLSMGDSYNRKFKYNITTHTGDCWIDEWHVSLESGYNVIGAATALHWLSRSRLAHIFTDLHSMLKEGGLLIFHEPMRPIPEIHLKTDTIVQGSQGSGNVWIDFWRKVNDRLGYDYYSQYVLQVPPGEDVIDDDGLPVLEYIEYLQAAGFKSIDIVSKIETSICMAAVK